MLSLNISRKMFHRFPDDLKIPDDCVLHKLIL